MDRKEAISIAKVCAYARWGDHSYLSGDADAQRAFEPHEWVIDAILAAVDAEAMKTARSTIDIRGYTK